MWSQILLFLISLFSCIIVYRHLSDVPHPEYLSYIILLLTAVAMGMILTESGELDRAIELLLLLIMLFVLVLLLISIRLLQPDYARQPVIYSYFPLTIIPFYAYFVDSEILEFITLASVQAASILVYTGLVFSYWRSIEKGYLLFLSVLCFISAFCIYWYPDFNFEYSVPVTHLLIGLGMIVASFKFPLVLVQYKR